MPSQMVGDIIATTAIVIIIVSVSTAIMVAAIG